MKAKIRKIFAVFIIVSFLLPTLAGPLAAAPVAHDPLDYNVYYMKDTNQFYFLVTNPSSQVVKLNFPTEREFDLAIKKGNEVVWRYANSKKFNKTSRQENFLPGHAKFYKIDAPKLASHNYDINAFFAGGPSAGRVVAQTQLNWGSSSSWQPPVANEKNLSYQLLQLNNQELMFIVENNTSRNIKFNFPTAQEFDIAIYDAAWNKIWQDSWNKWYSPRGKTETLAPGQAKTYRTKLPKLDNRTYNAYAYFSGVQGQNAVANLRLSPNQGGTGGDWGSGVNWDIANKLSFGSWYNGGNQPQIAFEVKNKTNKPVKISYPVSKAIEVVVKGDNGFTWRYSNNLGGLSTTEIAAGGASYSFVYPPTMPKGNYKADIYYHAYSSYKPAASTSFKVW